MPIRLLTSGGGTTTIQPTTSASSVTLTVPSVNANVVTTGDTASVTQAMLGSGLAATGPLMSSRMSSIQTVNHNAYTKLILDNELYDTNSNYDVSLYRFTPNIAGYYFTSINLIYNLNSSRTYYLNPAIYKNGSIFAYTEDYASTNSGGRASVCLTSIIFLNGSTDYLEYYQYHYDYTSLTTAQLYPNTTATAYLVRAS